MYLQYLALFKLRKVIPLYTKLKQVASYITVCLFLGLDPGSTAEIESIIELTTEHWHGN